MSRFIALTARMKGERSKRSGSRGLGRVSLTFEPLAPAELESHRHHHAGGKAGGEGIGLGIAPHDRAARDDALGRKLLGEPLGVVTFGERDRRRDAAEGVVLRDEPRALEVPPFHAVEEIVEARAIERRHVFGGRAKRLGAEEGLGIDRARRRDDAAPDARRHLVGRIAAEAAEAQRGIMTGDRAEIIDGLSRRRGRRSRSRPDRPRS